MAVTRTELAAHIQAAFAAGPASRARLLEYAIGSHARPSVVDVLRDLPDKQYSGIRDLWYELGDLPIGA